VTVVGVSDCRLEVIKDSFSNEAGCICVCLESFENLCSGDRLFVFPPGIVIGRSRNKRVAGLSHEYGWFILR
jgi:hypothetical protein